MVMSGLMHCRRVIVALSFRMTSLDAFTTCFCVECVASCGSSCSVGNASAFFCAVSLSCELIGVTAGVGLLAPQ